MLKPPRGAESLPEGEPRSAGPCQSRSVRHRAGRSTFRGGASPSAMSQFSTGANDDVTGIDPDVEVGEVGVELLVT
jgi:hypothetical protein